MACETRTRVGLVVSSLKRGGAEKQTAYIARALHDAGVQIACYYLGPGGHYETILREGRISVSQIYQPNRPLWIIARLIRELYHFRPHIVFAPQFGDLLQAGIAGRLCGALIIGGLRSNGFQELKRHGRRSRWMLWLAHGIVANSVTGRRNLISTKVDPKTVRLVPNVIDLSEFQEQSAAPVSVALPSDRVVAAAVGSLHPGKRFDRFLDAMVLARRKAPMLFGVVAGVDRGCRRALEQKAAQAGLVPRHLMFLGECPNVPALLARSACLVVCSEFEGFPNTILEAMAAGVPVITTPAGDAPLIVRHRETGYVLENGEVTKMADYMVDIALSHETRLQLGAKGKRLCAEYDFDTLQVKLLRVFCAFATEHCRPKLVKGLQDRLRTSCFSGSSCDDAVSEPAC